MLAAAARAAPRFGREEEEGKGGAGAGKAISGDEVTPILDDDDLEGLPDVVPSSAIECKVLQNCKCVRGIEVNDAADRGKERRKAILAACKQAILRMVVCRVCCSQ